MKWQKIVGPEHEQGTECMNNGWAASQISGKISLQINKSLWIFCSYLLMLVLVLKVLKGILTSFSSSLLPLAVEPPQGPLNLTFSIVVHNRNRGEATGKNCLPFVALLSPLSLNYIIRKGTHVKTESLDTKMRSV